MDLSNKSQKVCLELVEIEAKKDHIPVLLTTVNTRLLGDIISRLKECVHCQLPFNCSRVRKGTKNVTPQFAELCICIGKTLIDAIIRGWNKVSEAEMPENQPATTVINILRSIELRHNIQLVLYTKILGDTWPIVRPEARPILDTVVPLEERYYVERCISKLTDNTTIVVGSSKTGFIGVFKQNQTEIQRTSKADMLNHPIHLSIGNAMTQVATVENAYLLTGYDVFVLEEPCIFCSMCLLHARVKRVFYSSHLPQNGGLNKDLMLPKLPGLNHRFPVIRFSKCEEECHL